MERAWDYLQHLDSPQNILGRLFRSVFLMTPSLVCTTFSVRADSLLDTLSLYGSCVRGYKNQFSLQYRLIGTETSFWVGLQQTASQEVFSLYCIVYYLLCGFQVQHSRLDFERKELQYTHHHRLGFFYVKIIQFHYISSRHG
jgi:hypothetical protein